MYICNTIIMVHDILLLFWKVCSLERIAEIRRTFRTVIENDTPRIIVVRGSGAINLISVILSTDMKII